MPAASSSPGPENTPVRSTLLPYGLPSLDDSDRAAVLEVLRGPWLTTGPRVSEFEQAFARFTGAAQAVAVNSGTAALHTALAVLDLQPGDEVLVPPLTFAATANAVLYCGATPVFVDLEPDTLLLDPAAAAARLTPRTRALLAVDYAGQPCDYAALGELARRHRLVLVADACHAVGGSFRGQSVGTLADLSTFSFHPVKHLTTGEGGMVTTANAEWAARMRRFRNHGLSSDHRERTAQGAWFYEMTELGFNYRLSDLQCALGLSQLRKVPAWVQRRREIAAHYDSAFRQEPGLRPLATRPDRLSAYHLYVVRLELEKLAAGRDAVFRALRAEGIGANVHYVPVYLHPYYRKRLGLGPGLCPRAEAAYERLITLPLFPAMSAGDVEDVIRAVSKVLKALRRG